MVDIHPHVLQSQLVQKELLDELQDRLTAAEQALAAKQTKIDDMKQEIFQKEKELETISVFQAQVSGTQNIRDYNNGAPFSVTVAIMFFIALFVQAEVYSSDFYAERAAREKLHEERERLAAQLEFVKKQNCQLQEEMDSLSRYGIRYKAICRNVLLR